jgi:hypothetical protein
MTARNGISMSEFSEFKAAVMDGRESERPSARTMALGTVAATLNSSAHAAR